MKKKFSKNWISSKQPRKQRKYRYNAPLHIKQKFASANLSKELRKRYNKRSLIIKKGDTVKIMRGQFKGKTSKVNMVSLKKTKIYLENISLVKKDGTKVFYPINPSNLQIVELLLDDKERKKILERKNVTPIQTSSAKNVATEKKGK